MDAVAILGRLYSCAGKRGAGEYALLDVCFGLVPQWRLQWLQQTMLVLIWLLRLGSLYTQLA